MTETASNSRSGDEVVYRTHFIFNSVYVLESLPEGAPKTGERLYDEVVFPKSRALDECFTKYIRVSGARDLFSALEEICANTLQANHRPIVHFEAHGDALGIELADGNHVEWRQIVEPLAAINEASGFNLVVIAICCKGWFLTAAMLPTDRAPVGLIVGPPENMQAAALLEAASRFYEALFKYIDFNIALEAMNGWKPYSSWLLRPASAEVLYCRVFRTYLERLCTQENLRERENQLIADLVRANSLDLVQVAALRLEVRRHLEDHEWWYEKLRERFLMIDLFPQNRERFGLTYQVCLPAKGESSVAD